MKPKHPPTSTCSTRSRGRRASPTRASAGTTGLAPAQISDSMSPTPTFRMSAFDAASPLPWTGSPEPQKSPPNHRIGMGSRTSAIRRRLSASVRHAHSA